MEQKTTIKAEEGQPAVLIAREFDLPVEVLFQAYADPALVAQWMGTNVLHLESRPHGSYRFETTDAQGRVVFRAHGVIHAFCPAQRITRTFEMENAPFGVQLEFLRFEARSATTSALAMRVVYESLAHRDHQLRQPFAQGLSRAHDRLQAILNPLT